MSLQVFNYDWKLMDLEGLVEAGKTEISSPVFVVSPDQIIHGWLFRLTWKNLEDFAVHLHLEDKPLQCPISVKFNYKVYNKKNLLVAEKTSDEFHTYEKSESWTSSTPANLDHSSFNFKSIGRICFSIELGRDKTVFNGSQASSITAESQSIEDPPKLENNNGQHEELTVNTVINEQDLKVCIVDHSAPYLKVNNNNRTILERAILTAIFDWVKKHPKTKAPVFKSKETFKEYKIITCANQRSLEFLKESVSKIGELWKGARLGVMSHEEIIGTRPKVFIRIPLAPQDTQLDSDFGEMIRSVLEGQNPDIPIHNWKLIRVGRDLGGHGLLSFAVDEYTISELEKNNILNLATSEVIAKKARNTVIIEEGQEEVSIEKDLYSPHSNVFYWKFTGNAFIY